MTKLALMIAMVSIVVVLGIGAIGVWLTAEARVFGLIVLAAGTVAALLVAYFEWRNELSRRLTGHEAEDGHVA